MTPTEIANHALALVCEHRVVQLSDNTVTAARVREFLPSAVREVLASFPWRCARKRVVLPRLAERPAFGWAHQFQLPPDYLRAVELNGCLLWGEVVPRFVVEGDKLLADLHAAHLVYVADVGQDTTGAGMEVLDALCARAVYTKLAADLAFPFTQSAAVQTSCAQQHAAAMYEARKKSNLDAQERPTPFYEGESVAMAREGGLPFRSDGGGGGEAYGGAAGPVCASIN